MELILKSEFDFVKSLLENPAGKIALEPKRFPDGEFFIKVPEKARGQNCYLYAAASPDNIFEILITIDTLKRASAKKVTLVTPYLPYSRQDRRAEVRTPISAKVLANMIEASGCDHVITVDLHAPQIEGFYNIPVDNLTMGYHLISTIRGERKLHNPVLVAPDAGAAKRTRQLGENFNLDIAILDKTRISPTEVKSTLVGEVSGRDCILIDDMISSGGTMIEGQKVLRQMNAKTVHAAAIHLLGDSLKISPHFDSFTCYNTCVKGTIDQKVKFLDCSLQLDYAVKMDMGGLDNISNFS